MAQQKKGPASVAALNRTARIVPIRHACFFILGNELAKSNPTAFYTTTTAYQLVERSRNPAAHVGRTDAPLLLAQLVKMRLLSKEDANWLRYVARLVAAEGNLAIDPLIEVARRVLELRCIPGGRHG